jgi:hypothetical protein
MAAKKDDRNDGRDEATETGVKPLVDESATEPAVPASAEVLAPSHDSEAMRARTARLDPARDASIPKRHPGGDSPNESPEIALAPQEIPPHDSNEELHIAAAKRAGAQAVPGQPPQDRHARSNADEQAAPSDGAAKSGGKSDGKG